MDDAAQLLASEFSACGVRPGDLVAVALTGHGVGLASDKVSIGIDTQHPIELCRQLEISLSPRWVWWSKVTATTLCAGGLRVSKCWDLAAVHRLVHGGWVAEVPDVWASAYGLDRRSTPELGQLDLLANNGDDGEDPNNPVRPDGYLRPEWVAGGWSLSAQRMRQWAGLVLDCSVRQNTELARNIATGDPFATARSESAAELLCSELERDGLPIHRETIETLIRASAGPRTRSHADAEAVRKQRDEAVLQHAPVSGERDLRNPLQVKALLRRVGIDLPDTRAWRLEPHRNDHPMVEALLAWRKAERIATTYGYEWLDAHVSDDGRLRGGWSGSDGAAGRMTAQAGLHNLPAELRPAVIAEPGFLFVRADLGQIEPRVLAAISSDPALSRATQDDDLYAPVAARLGVERPIAKVAVLAAMYGQTSGAAGEALRGMDAAYPVAMRYLRDADEAGQLGRNLRTFGGRLLTMGEPSKELDDRQYRAMTAGRGRFARNAMVQGAAAEFFKVWAVLVRARTGSHGARVVLCLHDELLVHAPVDTAPEVADLLTSCLDEAAGRWARNRDVRFVADVSIIERWSDAKG